MSFLQPFYDFLLFVSAKKEKKSRTGQKNNSFYELFKKKYDMLEKEAEPGKIGRQLTPQA